MKLLIIKLAKNLFKLLKDIIRGLLSINKTTNGLSYYSWGKTNSEIIRINENELKYIEEKRTESKNGFRNILLTFIILISIFLLLQCENNKKRNKQKLALLLQNSYDDTRAFFSYPGRFIEKTEKREVLDSILSLIHNAKFSLKIYAYSFNNPEIIEALAEAKNRGVFIRFTGDKEQNYDLLQEKGFSINIWKQSGLHHIKVIVADDRIMFTGTGNFSRHGLTNDWNGYIQFTIEEKNRNSMLEFLEEKYALPVLNTNNLQFISSPENGFLSQDLLLEKISGAKESINFLIFDHFDATITHALKQATERGVTVTGVYDAPVDEEGEYLINQFYGITSRIYKDGNEDIIETAKFPEGGLLHHKSMIIDGKTVLSGSYNYSTNARDSNREILFNSESPYLVSEFQKEFDRVRMKSYPQELNHFHISSKRINLETNPRIQDLICLPQNVNKPIVELGEGIWKTYLYYPKVLNTNCWDNTNYANISSGLTHASRTDFFSLGELWDSVLIYDHDSNISYSYKSSQPNNLIFTGKEIKIIKPKYLSFSSKNIYFEMKEKLQIKDKQIQYWIPGKEIRTAMIEMPTNDEYGFSASIPTSSTERFYGASFIEAENEVYFFCYLERTRSQRDLFTYLLKSIYLKNPKQNTIPECITN